MGKLHLWRKHSYIRLEKDKAGGVWTVFRVLAYNRWYNVKKMLPYRKQKSDDKNSQSKVNPDGQYRINHVNELEGYDALNYDSASVNSTSGRALSTLIAKEDKSGNLEQDQAEIGTPTMVSLLKAAQKLDSPRKRGLSRSGTYPSPNTSLHNLGYRTTPSKVESKHTEIWPVMNHGYELRKAKSLRTRRSSSLNEISFDKFDNFLDTDSKKETRKLPSLSEKELTSLGDRNNPDLLLRKCFSARVSLLENESYYSGMGGLRVDSQRASDCPKHTENSIETKLDGNWVSFVDDKGQRNPQEYVQLEEEQIDGVTSENPLPVGDLAPVLQTSSTCPCENAQSAQPSNNQFIDSLEMEIEDCSEELEYVRHVLDVLGFVGGEITGECLDEALDPQLFDEIEVLCPFKPKELARISRLDRKILFHLIIEALVEMHEKLFAYYAPNSSAFSCNVGAMPTGETRIVEEVWVFASKYLNWRPKVDPKLDLAMALDMTKSSSSWKNPQVEIEFAGLDLEELIFDDLLDEIF